MQSFAGYFLNISGRESLLSRTELDSLVFMSKRTAITKLLLEIANGCKKTSDHAIELLYASVSKGMESHCESLAVEHNISPSAPEDIALDSFYQIVKSIEKNGWKPTSKRGFLHRIIRKACFERTLTAETANATLKRSSQTVSLGPEHEASGAQRADIAELELSEYVAKLDKVDQRILRMLKEGYAVIDISQKLNLAERSVYRRMHFINDFIMDISEYA